MATLGEYLQTWKLMLSTTKTVSAVFHLNKEDKCELKLNFNNETLPFCSKPKYLRITLDRSLTYRRHHESLHKKLTSRLALLRRLAGSGWGAGTTTLRTATLALVHWTAEYCAPVWCHSAHTRFIDRTINDALQIASLRPIPGDNLPILAGIQPADPTEQCSLAMKRNITQQLCMCMALHELLTNLLALELARPEVKILKYMRSTQYEFRVFKNVDRFMSLRRCHFDKAGTLLFCISTMQC